MCILAQVPALPLLGLGPLDEALSANVERGDEYVSVGVPAAAVRKAAYQSGQALVEERSGQLCDYARKERVVEEGLSLPGGVPPIALVVIYPAREILP